MPRCRHADADADDAPLFHYYAACAMPRYVYAIHATRAARYKNDDAIITMMPR